VAGFSKSQRRWHPDDGQSTYVELRDLANKNGLVLSTNQRSKTAIALEEITAAHPQ
jgi:hypothetical protein